MTPSRVHQAVLRKDRPLMENRRGFYIQDLPATRRGWSDAEQLALIRAGFGYLVFFVSDLGVDGGLRARAVEWSRGLILLHLNLSRGGSEVL